MDFRNKIPQEIKNMFYDGMPPHTMYIGEIIDVIEK